MTFLTPGERLRELRTALSIKQYELEEAGITRNFISMTEANKRGLSKKSAERIVEFFNRKAQEKGIHINIDAEELLLQPNEEARIYCKQKLDSGSALKHYEEISEICISYELYDLLGDISLLKAEELYSKLNYKEAFVLYYKAMDFYSRLNSCSKHAFIYNKLGKCKMMELNYSEAFIYFEKAYNLALLTKDMLTYKNTTFNLALSYKKLNKIQNAIIYIDAYISACDLNTNLENYIDAIIVKANCYLESKDLTTCVELYKEAVKKVKDKYNPHLIYVYNNLARVSIEIKDYTTSLHYLEESMEISRMTNNKLICSSLRLKASILFTQNKTSESLEVLQEGIKQCMAFSEKACLLQCYYLLSEIYIQMNKKELLEDLYNSILLLLKEIGNEEEVIKINRKLALLKLDLNDLENSKRYLNESI